MVFKILTNFVQYNIAYLSYHQNTKWLVTVCECIMCIQNYTCTLVCQRYFSRLPQEMEKKHDICLMVIKYMFTQASDCFCYLIQYDNDIICSVYFPLKQSLVWFGWFIPPRRSQRFPRAGLPPIRCLFVQWLLLWCEPVRNVVSVYNQPSRRLVLLWR